MYTNFRSFSSQYSRRLLSILAHQQKQFVLKVTRGVRRNFLNTFSTSCINNFVFNLRGTSKKAKRKKNAEHTRMYTIFSQLSSPIFTSVVVYSRTT